MTEINPVDIDRQFLIRDYNDKISKLKESGITDVVGQAFLDKDQNPTQLGQTHVALMDEGLINPDGTLTDKGSVFNTTYRESIDAPEQVYIQREKLGLNELDKANEEEGPGFISSMGDALTEFGKNVWSMSPARVVAKAGLDLVGKEIDLVESGVRSLFGEEQAKKKTDISPSFLQSQRTGAELINAQASMAQGGLDTLFMAGGAMQYLPARAVMAIQGKEDLQLAVKQKQERDKRTFEEVNGAELLDSMIGIDTLMKNRQNLVAQVGEEEVAKQERGNRTAGGFVYDPINVASMGVGVMSNAGLKTALWAERTALTGRGLALEASDLAAKRANLEAKIAKADALVGHTTERANALNSVGDTAGAMRYNAHSTRAAELVTNLTGDVEGIAARQATIDADLASIASKQAVADKIINTTEKFNAIRQMPANAVAGVTGAVGEGLIKTDEFVSSVMDNLGVSAAYDAFKAMPTQIASLASTSMIGPLGAITSAISTALSKGPLLKSISNFSRVVGEQVVKERGSSSFWRRVANAGVDKPQRMFAKFMDEATLGGSATQAAKIVAKGTAQAYPMNLTFEILQDPDLDVSNAAGRAATPSLIFGGGGAGAAQIFKGSAGRLQDVRNADHINMIRSLTDSQKSTFYKMDGSGQQLAASYAAAYPNLNWEFKESGASNYDPASNSVSVNINTNNPIRGLITHEVLHYGTIKNNLVPVMNQLLFGFDGEGGLVKSKDGTLDPHFQKFMDEYNARLEKADLPPAPLDKIGEEYFIESTVDHVLDVVDRGKLAEYTGRTESSRMISNLVRTFVDQRPILRDFFFKTGGVYDSNGRMVQGNGILNGGIMSHPESRKLVQKMLRESAGDTNLAMGKPSKKLEKGKLVVDETSPVVDSFHAILEYDSNGNPVKVNGVHRTISRQVDDARSMAGLILTEAQSKRVAGGYMPNAGELSKAKDGSWQGRYIHRALFDELSVKSELNSKQIAILKDISRATELNQGTRFLVVNHPATIKGRGGKVRYASLEATLRDVVPTAFSVTKQGNILVHLMSVDQLNANIEKRAASKSGDRLYGSNTELIKQDIAAMMDLHAENKVTDGHYQGKYGANWKQHKDFINTVFGLMTKEQRSYNPMFDADKIGDGGVFRTYRADRISRAVKDHATPMPMGYEHIKVNLLPEGVPAAVEARYTEELRRRTGQMPEVERIPGKTKRIPEVTDAAQKLKEGKKSDYRYMPERKIESQKTHVIENKVGMEFPKSNPKSGYTEVKMQTSDGNEMIYKFQSGSNVPPEVRSYTTKNGEWAAITQADRHDGVDSRMGGVAYPFLESNNVVVTASDGNTYRPVWASLGESTTSSMKSMSMQTTNGTFFVHLMGEEAHISNNQTFNDYFTILKKAKISEESKKNISIVRELASRKTEIELNNTSLYNKSRASKTPIDEAKLQKIDPDISKFFRELGGVKSSKTKGNEAKAKEQFNAALDKLKKKEWFAEFESSLNTKKYADRSSRDTFHVRGAQIDALYSIPDVPSVKKYLSDSSDFIGGKTGDIVAAIQVSKNQDAFRIYTGDDPIQESKMKPLEKEIRDKLLASGKFKSHVSYPWVVLGPGDGSNFMLDKSVSAETLFPNYRNEHPSETVKSGNSTTILGAMRMKLGVPMIVGGKTK